MKILIVTDAPNLTTGYGRMGQSIAGFLASKLGSDNLKYVAIGGNSSNQQIPYEYQIIPVIKDTRDVDGRLTTAEVITKFKPDIVFTLGDLWQFDWVKDLTNRETFKWVFWLPIDGAPIPSRWLPILDNINLILTTSEWGKWVVCNRDRKFLNKTFVLRHGVDLNIFNPAKTEEERMEAKAFLGVKPETFVVGTVARNQLRKNLPVLIGAFRKFLQPYIICTNQSCSITFGTGDECKHCKNKKDKIFYKPPKWEQMLYMHTEKQSEYGWDLLSMAKEMAIFDVVKVPEKITEPGKGYIDYQLAQIYKAMDVFVLPTMGEGFGLPILEAMASGVPVITTDYSGHVDYAYGSAILLPVKARFREQITGMSRAIVDEDHLFQALDFLYYDKNTDATEKHRNDWEWISKQLYDALGLNREEPILTGKKLRYYMANKGLRVAESLNIKNMHNNLWDILSSMDIAKNKIHLSTSVSL